MQKMRIKIPIGRQFLFLLFGVTLIICSLIFSSLCEAVELYENVRLDSNGQLHIMTIDKREILPTKREIRIGGKTEKQVAFSSPIILDDKTTVGWLAEYPNCCTSYPIPLELVIYRNGAVLRVFNENELPIWIWKFEAIGTQVGFKQETVHGGGGLHYELRDIITGRLLERYDGEPAPNAPAWVLDLKLKIIIQPDEE